MKVLVRMHKGDDISSFSIFRVVDGAAPVLIGDMQVANILAGMECTAEVLAANWKNHAHLMGHVVLDGAIPLSHCTDQMKDILTPWINLHDNLQEAKN